MRWTAVILLWAAPLAAAESVWLEGESSTDTTFNRHGWYEDTDLRKDLMSPGRPETTQGDWLAHYVPGAAPAAYARWSFTVAEGGTYAWWLRANPISATLRYAIDGGARQPLDLSDHREVVNVVRTIDIRWLAWVKVGDFTLSPGPHTVEIEVSFNSARNDTHGGIDCLALVNFPWEPVGTLRPGEILAPPGPDVWFPLRPGDDPFSPASITDLTALGHAPAGRYGALRRAGNALEFAGRPGVPVKLVGVNTGRILPTEALQRRQARLWRKHGIQLVRLHPVESVLGLLQRDPIGGGRSFDPAALDRLDRWFALLKEEGIYSGWSPFYPHVITADDGYPASLYAELDSNGAGKSSAGMVAFQPALQDAEWAWLERLLDHVNPYTGLAYKDDPALAILETHNEDSVFWHWPLNPLSAGTPYPLHTAELKRQWMEWVRARYGDDTTLAAAWGAGRRAGDSVSNASMDIYGAWQLAAAGPDWGAGPVLAERPRAGDFIRFLAETQRGYYERRVQQARARGFAGVLVTTAWMAGGPASQAANHWSDAAGDAIDRHSYWGGGVGGWYVTTGAVNNETHLATPGRGVMGGFSYGSGGPVVPLYAAEDRPAILSEWTSSPPNQWKAEAAPLWFLYGLGLQGADVSIHFAASLPRMGSGWPSSLRAPDPFVNETPHYLGQFPALSRAVLEGHIREGDLVAARRLAFDEVCRGYDALSQVLPSGGWPGEDNLLTPPEVLAIGRVTFRADAGLPASDRTDWTTRWDQAAQVVTSSTDELVWDYGNRVVEIRAARTQGLVGWAAGRNYSLPGAEVQVTTPFVSLLLSSLDGQPIAASSHILVTALARDIQLGGAYSIDGTNLDRIGGPPLLLEPVQASIDFPGGTVTSARAVDIHGVPSAVDVARTGNTITIDGSYETYYYEVRRSFPGGRCLSRTEADTIDPLSPGRAALFLGSPRPDGITLDPAALHAQVPYRCSFSSGSPDPEPVLDPAARPLLYYQLDDPAPLPLRLVKDATGRTVRISF